MGKVGKRLFLTATPLLTTFYETIIIITHHVDQLHESEAKIHVHFLCHVLHGSNEFVVTSEQVSHQSFLILGAETCETTLTINTNEEEMRGRKTDRTNRRRKRRR